jgi:hypothetical protein
MKDYTIKLGDKFVVPNNIAVITTAEWEIIIKYLSEIFLKHDSVLSKITESEVQLLLEAKYAAEIIAKDERIASQGKELITLKDTHEKQLRKLRVTIEDNIKVSNNEAILAIKTSLQSTVESKDLIIQNLKEQVTELQQHLTQFISTTTEPLQEQINNLQKELSATRETYEKQLKKQRISLEDQTKVSLAGAVEANKLFLQETVETKDSIIQELKTRSAEQQQQLDKCTKLLNDTQLGYVSGINEEKSKLQSALEVRHQDEIKELKNQKVIMEEHYKLNFASVLESKNLTIQEMKGRSVEIQQLLEQYGKQLNELRVATANNLIEEKTKLQSLLESKHEAYIHNILSKHQSEIKELNNLRIKDKIDLQNSAMEQLQNTLLEKLEPITKFYGGTNMEKGNGGEIAIRDILTASSTYNDSIVIDVSNQTATGDIIFNWRKMKCLIEVKNKIKLTKEDIDKFIRDVNQSADKINCAIFVSLQTNQFPGRSREIMQLDYTNGIPIIFTYMPPPSKEIHFAISCLERIIQTYETTNSCQEELRQHFLNYYRDVLASQKYFGKELVKCQREVKTISKQFEYYNTLYEQLTPVHAKPYSFLVA